MERLFVSIERLEESFVKRDREVEALLALTQRRDTKRGSTDEDKERLYTSIGCL